MDHLPVEILEPIFRSACTDDGSTGCALSSVSRYVRAASAPVRYQSVALRGARQICAFLALLDRVNIEGSSPNDQGNKRKNTVNVGRVHQPLAITSVTVKHLFVADCKLEVQLWQAQSPAEWMMDVDSQVGLFPRLVRKIKHSHIYDRNTSRRIKAFKTQEAAYCRADVSIQDLLARLAPSLQHLCIDQRLHSSFLHSLTIVSFPALVELTCRINLLSPGEIHLRALFPVLERLHCVGEPKSTPSTFFVVLNAQDLPTSLSHVLFSNIDIPRHLEPILGHPKTSPWARQEALEIYVSRTPGRFIPPLRPMLAPIRSHSQSPQSQLSTPQSSQHGPVVLPDIDLYLDSNPNSDHEHNCDQDHSSDHKPDHDDDQSYHRNQDENHEQDDGQIYKNGSIYDESQDETRNNVNGPGNLIVPGLTNAIHRRFTTTHLCHLPAPASAPEYPYSLHHVSPHRFLVL
jgi:hypothetical protein